MAPVKERSRLRFRIVSTHHTSISGSRTTHADCREALLKLGPIIQAEDEVQQSYSGDGLIAVSFFPGDPRVEFPPTSLSKPYSSPFPEL